MSENISPEWFREQADKLRLFTTLEAATRAGITAARFLRLAKRLGIEPEIVAVKSKVPHYHWRLDAIGRVAKEAKRPTNA